MIFYTTPRYTKDIDVWISPDPANAAHVHAALVGFGAPLQDVSVADLSTPGLIVQIGVEPNRIDVLTSIADLRFDEAWERRTASAYGGVPIWILSFEDLVSAKRHGGRPQDLLDLDNLLRSREV